VALNFNERLYNFVETLYWLLELVQVELLGVMYQGVFTISMLLDLEV
jgi:hypothetical protein